MARTNKRCGARGKKRVIVESSDSDAGPVYAPLNETTAPSDTRTAVLPKTTKRNRLVNELNSLDIQRKEQGAGTRNKKSYAYVRAYALLIKITPIQRLMGTHAGSCQPVASAAENEETQPPEEAVKWFSDRGEVIPAPMKTQ